MMTIAQAVAVGSAVGGDMYGWTSCLEGGLGGALIGLGVSVLLYTTLCLCLSDIAASARNGPVTGSHIFVHGA
jgi:hypothetical protein